MLKAIDTIHFPINHRHSYFEFSLNRNLQLEYQGKKIKKYKNQQGYNLYRIPLAQAQDQKKITLTYSGALPSTLDCQFTLEVCSLLNEKGVYLNPALAWYPMNNDLHTFQLNATLIGSLAQSWQSLTQGKRTNTTQQKHQWQMDKPQDAIYFIAGPFSVYQKKGDVAEAQVYLLNDDPQLAQRYLDKTLAYLSTYQALLGNYPYHKFATVESFWESGWGMPAFTLLGSRIMRFPFILKTSLPHEILHNWWGNSVYIDPRYGNWSEGLTAYLSDYLLKENDTDKQYSYEAIAYRRNALHKYSSFTQKNNDFPIKDFRSRHSAATQAVGYSKLLMVLHVLRQQLGDPIFFAALKNFYQTYQFKYADTKTLIQSLTQSASLDPAFSEKFFQQWIMQKGAPRITIKDWQLTNSHNDNEHKQLSVTLQQANNPQKPFSIHVPIYSITGNKYHWEQYLNLTDNTQTFTIALPKATEKIAIDPYFETLRRPLDAEIPANLQAFRDPSTKSIRLTHDSLAWKNLAKQLKQQFGKHYRSSSNRAETVIQFGLDNSHFNLTDVSIDKNLPLSITEENYQINQQSFSRKNYSLVFATRSPQQRTHITIVSPNAEQATMVLRKLRHYGKYSYLIFDKAGENQLKGEWLITQSPLTVNLMQP
ncbi:MAG: M1 family aminopeptidase [bacterium]